MYDKRTNNKERTFLRYTDVVIEVIVERNDGHVDRNFDSPRDRSSDETRD